MAMIFGALSFRRVFPLVFKSAAAKPSATNVVVLRQVLTAPSGVILPEPKKIPFPFVKLLLVLAPSIYIGASIAKNGATILEENEIFVPTDDDDED